MNSKKLILYKCGKCGRMYYTSRRADECCTQLEKKEEATFSAELESIEYRNNIEYGQGEVTVVIEIENSQQE